MMEVYLGAEPTITESIAMTGGSGQAQIDQEDQIKKAKDAGLAKARRATEEFDRGWKQGVPN